MDLQRRLLFQYLMFFIVTFLFFNGVKIELC